MSVVDSLIRTDEQRLLVLVARTSLDSDHRRELREFVARGLDWGPVTACAWKNKVLPLVYRTLSLEVADLVPDDALAEMRLLCCADAGRNLRLTAELVRLVQRLQAEGIPALPLKGPLLAKRLYGDLGLRQFSDLDVLVPPSEFPRALSLAESLGYRIVRPAVPLTPQQRVAIVRHRAGHCMNLQVPGTDTLLELHWRFAPDGGFAVDSEEFWRGLETTELAGRELLDLPVGDLLLYLCLHGSDHGWERLSWLLDLAVALHRNPRVDWAPLLLRAERWRSRRYVLLGLYLAHRLVVAPLPPALAVSLRAEAAHLEALGRMSSLFRERTKQEQVWFRARLREGLAGKLDTLVDRLIRPNTRTVEALRLPPALFPVYFLLQPAMLFFRHFLRRPVARLLGSRGADPGRDRDRPDSDGL